MPKRFIKRYLPDSHEVRRHPWISRFGHRLHDPNLWHLNRRSFSGGVAVGLFCALLPIPGQMIAAAALAILFRVNLPTALVLVWMTNPLTIPPIFFGAYLFGCLLLGTRPVTSDLAEWQAILEHLDAVWIPLLTGSLVLGTLLAGLGYAAVRILWRWYVLRKREDRRLARTERKRIRNPDSGTNENPVIRLPEADPPGGSPPPAATDARQVRTVSHR